MNQKIATFKRTMELRGYSEELVERFVSTHIREHFLTEDIIDEFEYWLEQEGEEVL